MDGFPEYRIDERRSSGELATAITPAAMTAQSTENRGVELCIRHQEGYVELDAPLITARTAMEPVRRVERLQEQINFVLADVRHQASLAHALKARPFQKTFL